MELASEVFVAQVLYSLQRYFEFPLEQIGRRALKRDRLSARTKRPVESRAKDYRGTEKSKARAFARSCGRHGQVEHDAAARRIGSNNDITVTVLALDAYNARVYHDMLEVRGYQPVTALNLEHWQSTLGECEPDLILLDLCSAGHPSIDVARAIMRDPRYASAPVIIVTDVYNSGDLHDPARIIVDCDDRIFKPISVDGFYRPIEANLKRAAVRRTIRQ